MKKQRPQDGRMRWSWAAKVSALPWFTPAAPDGSFRTRPGSGELSDSARELPDPVRELPDTVRELAGPVRELPCPLRLRLGIESWSSHREQTGSSAYTVRTGNWLFHPLSLPSSPHHRFRISS